MALFLIAGTALMISQFSTSYNNKGTSIRRACESYTHSLTGLVREETPFREVTKVLPVNTGTLAPDFTADSRALPKASYDDNSLRYYINYDPNAPTGHNRGPFLQNFQQIQGSIRTLASMYNKFPQLRCQFAAYARLDPSNDNALPSPTEFLNLPGNGSTKIEFRIEPFRLSSGASLCSRTAAFPRPPGLRKPEENVYVANSGSPTASPTIKSLYQAHDATGIYNDADYTNGINSSTMAQTQTFGGGPVGDPDLGFRFSARMEYTFEGQQYDCISTEEFAYPADSSAPQAPDLAKVINNNNFPPKDLCEGPAVPGAASIQVGYLSSAGKEPGVQFLCKDMSWIRVPTASPLPKISCGNGAAVVPYYSGATPGSPYPFTADVTRNKNWVPCTQLRQCGRMPSVATADFNYTLSYSNLPYGCYMNMEVVAVDTAGNRSTPVSSGFLSDSVNVATDSTTTPPLVTHNNEIYYPTCGNNNARATSAPAPYYQAGLGYYCPPDGWGEPYESMYPKGYYTCRSKCCEGAGCTPL